MGTTKDIICPVCHCGSATLQYKAHEEVEDGVVEFKCINCWTEFAIRGYLLSTEQQIIRLLNGKLTRQQQFWMH